MIIVCKNSSAWWKYQIWTKEHNLSFNIYIKPPEVASSDIVILWQPTYMCVVVCRCCLQQYKCARALSKCTVEDEDYVTVFKLCVKVSSSIAIYRIRTRKSIHIDTYYIYVHIQLYTLYSCRRSNIWTRFLLVTRNSFFLYSLHIIFYICMCGYRYVYVQCEFRRIHFAHDYILYRFLTYYICRFFLINYNM